MLVKQDHPLLAFLKAYLLSLRIEVAIALLSTLCTCEIQELNYASSENAKNVPPPSPPKKKKKSSDIFRVHTNNAKQGVLMFHLIEL